MSFNSMIHQIERARKRDRASVFILFTLKCLKIKDPKKIEKWTNKISFSTSANV